MNRLLIAGFGDIARRAVERLERRFAVTPLCRRTGFDLDRPETLAIGGSEALLHCAPPPAEGDRDTRTAHLLAALEKGRILPARLVYVSTSGVYGDCGGALVDESRPVAPGTARARRRVDAEEQLTGFCASRNIALVVLRAEDDVYTNHVHADDLAAIAVRSLEDDAPAGTYNAADDTHMKMGDWFDLVADIHGLPRPARIGRVQAEREIPAALLSFMSESRRLDNRRLKHRLGVRLRFPTVDEGLRNEHAVDIDESA